MTEAKTVYFVGSGPGKITLYRGKEAVQRNIPFDGARDALIEQSVRSYVARLEHYCRLAPYNWFNFYDYWEKGA